LIPLTVRNGRALEDLDPDDAVELPCQVSSRGVQVAAVGRAPEAVRPLLLQVKEYSRLAVRASAEHSREMALAALEKNPLVGTREVAEQVLGLMADPDQARVAAHWLPDSRLDTTFFR